MRLVQSGRRALAILAPLMLAAPLLCGMSAGALAAEAAPASEPPSAPLLRIETGMHTAIINRVSVDASGRLAATASDDKTVRLWSLPDGRPVATLRVPIGTGPEDRLYSVALSPDGKTVAAGGQSGLQWEGRASLYLFDVATRKIVQRMPRMPSEVMHLAFSPDGKRLAAAFGSGAGVTVYDMGSGRVVGVDANYGQKSANWVAFARDGRMATTAFDGAVRLYDASMKLIAKRDLPGTSRPFSVAFSPDGSLLAVGMNDSPKVELLSGSDLKSRATPDTSDLRGGNLAAVTWIEDGRQLLLAAGGSATIDGVSGIIRVWSGAGSGRAVDIPVAKDSITQIESRGNGEAVFVSAAPSWGRIGAGRKLMEVVSGIANFREITAGRFAVSDDGLTLEFGITAKGQRPMRLDLRERSYAPAPKADPSLSRPVTESPRLKVTNWSRSTAPMVGNRKLRLDGEERTHSLAIAPDGMSFLLGGDYWLRWFDNTGALIEKVAIPAMATGVAITRPGTMAVVALSDGTLHWYNLNGAGKPLEERATLFVHGDGQRWVAWTPEGFFDHAEAGGKDLVGYHFNKGKSGNPEWITFAQVYQLLHSSDLVVKKIAGGYEAEIAKTYAAIGDLRSRFERKPLPKIDTLEYCWTPPGGAEICRPISEMATRGFVRDTSRPAGPAPAAPTATAPVSAPAAPAAAGSTALSVTVPDEVSRLKLRFRVADGGGGVGDIGVYVNDRNIDRQDMTRAFRRDLTSIVAPAAAGQVFDRTVALDPGVNRIELRVYDGARSAFASSGQIEIRRPAPPPAAAQKAPVPTKPRLFVLAAGVDNYINPAFHLNFPVADAEGVTSTLKGRVADLYEKVMVPVVSADRKVSFAEYKGGRGAMANEDASREMIEKAFVALTSGDVLRPADTVVIYLAGHGTREDGDAGGARAAGKFYFITANVAGPDSVEKEAFGQDALLQHLVAINGKKAHVLLVLDTCHSGAFAKGTSFDALANLNDEAGISVLAAAASNQEALDGYKPQGSGRAEHGVFAYAVIGGLTGGASADETGIVYPNNLARYVKQTVPVLAKEVSPNHSQAAKWQSLGEQEDFPLVRKFH